MDYDSLKKTLIEKKITLLNSYQLDSLWSILKRIKKENIPGCLIETGIYRGGSAIIIQYANQSLNLNKELYLYDSFLGLPNRSNTKIKNPKIEKHSAGSYAATQKVVRDNFHRFNVWDTNIHLIAGWFEDTLPISDTGPIALLRFDGDLYSSTLDVMNNLYHKVVDGGYIIIDDYCLGPCKLAIDEFRTEHNITDTIFTPYNEISTEKDNLCASYWKKGKKI